MKKTIIAAMALLFVATANATPPNIVYLMADDQSTYTMGCYGNPDVKWWGEGDEKIFVDGESFPSRVRHPGEKIR